MKMQKIIDDNIVDANGATAKRMTFVMAVIMEVT